MERALGAAEFLSRRTKRGCCSIFVLQHHLGLAGKLQECIKGTKTNCGGKCYGIASHNQSVAVGCSGRCWSASVGW